MMNFTPSPMGGTGQPLRPSRYRPAGCPNSRNHSDPERQGDCDCADLQSEEREAANPDICGSATVEACRASALRSIAYGNAYRCRAHDINSRHLESYDYCRSCGECIDPDEEGQCEPCWMRQHPRAVSR